MPKYVLAYHGGSMPEDPAAQAEGMAAWGAWFGSLGDAVIDVMVQAAGRLASAGAQHPAGKCLVSGSKSHPAGYSVSCRR